jgi:hypothetical protein
MMHTNGTAVPMPQYEARPASFPSSQDAPSQMMYSNSQQSIPQQYRSFPDANGSTLLPQASGNASPQIYTVRHHTWKFLPAG